MPILSDTGIPDIEIENNGTPHDSAAMQGTINSILFRISAWCVLHGVRVGKNVCADRFRSDNVNSSYSDLRSKGQWSSLENNIYHFKILNVQLLRNFIDIMWAKFSMFSYWPDVYLYVIPIRKVENRKETFHKHTVL